MFGGRISLVRYSKRFINLRHSRSFCNSNKTPQNIPTNSTNGGGGVNSSKFSDKRDLDRLDAYRDLDDLNFTKAAKILFSSSSPKKKKFGFDFHLVQLFFALMPSLAVYLVAKYSRYQMRKMEAELELKKKAEEEKKAKEMEATAADEKEPETNSELLKVKERLEALEATIKEIAVETKKQGQTRVDPNSRSEDKLVSDKNQASNQPPAQPLKQEDIEKKGSHEDKK
ncbi:uncharacterized protein LOC141648134 [Silene latifolia]|uniref:uncharacterized protein LOC141648134 n=1 Tax=Silene latifolia TaxID=37657 RepID=UPI003D77E959